MKWLEAVDQPCAVSACPAPDGVLALESKFDLLGQVLHQSRRQTSNPLDGVLHKSIACRIIDLGCPHSRLQAHR